MFETEKCAWLSNSTPKADDFPDTIPINRKFKLTEKKQHLCFNCLKCGTTVSSYSAKQGHVNRHVQDKIQCSDFFNCLLCPLDNVTFKSVQRPTVIAHLKQVHKVKDNMRKYYFDNRNKYLNVIQLVAIECFGKAFRIRNWKPNDVKDGETGTPSFTPIHCISSSSTVDNEDNKLNEKISSRHHV